MKKREKRFPRAFLDIQTNSVFQNQTEKLAYRGRGQKKGKL